MRVVYKEEGIFYDRIQVLAEKYEEYEFDSFLGPRKWWMYKGERVILTVPTSKMIERGDFLSFPYCVLRDWKIFGGQQIRWSWS